MKKNRHELRHILRSELQKRGCALGETPENFYSDMQKKTGEPIKVLYTILWKMRQRAGLGPQADKVKESRKKTAIYKHLEKFKMERTCPISNIRVTNEFSDVLADIRRQHPLALSSVPPGKRVGIVTGTPAALAI